MSELKAGSAKNSPELNEPKEQHSAPDRFHTVHYTGDDFFEITTASGHTHKIDVRSGRRAASGALELFLSGLGGCTAADVISILHKKRQDVTHFRARIREH